MAALDGVIPAIIGAANSAGDSSYEIARSLRFNDADTPELTRTPSSTGNTNTFTLSFWVKRCKLGSTQMIVQTGDDYANLFRAYWDGNDNFVFHQYNGSYVMNYITSAAYRDVGAWYHYVIAIDTTQAAAADRAKLYVNGAEITDFSSTTDPALNLTTGWNAAVKQRIGREWTTTYGNYYNYGGYLAEFYNVDGQQLAASDFGEYDSNNVWQPKQYAGGFDDWFDTSQTWSGLWSGSAGYGSFANLHDTNLTNYMQSLDATLTLSSPIAVTSLRILLQRYGASGTSLSINGTDESSQLPSAPSGIVWVDITGVTSLTSINVTSGDYSSNTLGLYAIEVNGKLLLDTGTSASNNGFHLNFSDNSSNSALGTDSSGNSNTFTVTNLTAENPTTLPGVDFDGTDDYLESADDADYSLGTNDFTMECYIFPRTFDNYKALMMKYTGTRSTSSWFWSLNSSGHILFYLYYGSSEMGIVTSGTGMTLNQWNHVACVRDGTTARVYINGVQVGTGSISTNSVNDSSTAVRIGEDSQGFYDLDGIMSNVRLVNGTCLYPDGTTFTVPSTPLTNVTNTKLLCCQSSSSATDATVSPNTLTKSGNTFATERSDGTAANDSMIDSPTNYTADSGNNGGNYATLNPLDFASSGKPTLKNGNLDAEAGSGWQTVAATIGNLTSGRWYWEATLGGGSGHRTGLSSVSRSNAPASDLLGSGDIAINSSDGQVYVDGSAVGTGVGSLSGKTVGIELDLDANSVSFYQNNSLIHTVSSLSSTASWTPVHATRYSVVDNLNFGQRPFAFPRTGYLSLCTTNLAEPTITDGSTAMDVDLWSGDGTDPRSRTLSMSPDLVWIKTRNQTNWHYLTDNVRGAPKKLYANSTNAEDTTPIYGQIDSLNSDGFTLGGGTDPSNPLSDSNQVGTNYVAWSWDAGTVANPVGDIWQGGATKYIGVKFSSASGGTISFGQTTGTTTVEVWSSSDNSNWTQQGGTLTLADGHTLTFTDQYVYIRNTSDATFTDWFAAATDNADGHYSSVTYPSGASWSGPAYTDYDWRDNGGVINEDGSIPSIVRANQTTGFSILTLTFPTYSGTSTVGHGLNAAPHFWIMKDRDSADGWYTGHISLGADKYLRLETTDAEGTSTTLWDNTLPSSSVIYNNGTSMTGAGDYVIYSWAPVEGYSAFGSYTATGSADGPFAYTGFRPKWIMIKAASSAGDMTYASWLLVDSKRDTYNVSDAGLFANKNASEGTRGDGSGTAGTWLDIVSNGFKIRYGGTEVNGVSGQTYVYAAFAEHPFKTSRAR